ncbi:MAG: segregation ATPase FtsK/SpoIIIE, family [Actinomycetota bacterium]|nr:segregation ATPase FtsK/SpoIIIE, family [Actinomycetota bacterium]
MSPTGTKQRPRRPAAKRAPARARPAPARRKAPARRPAPARNQAPPAFAKVAATIGRHINRQRHDVTAAALLFFAVIAALGLFAGAAGPVGRGLAWLCRALLGWTAPALPFLLAWIAGEVIRSRTEEAGRVAVGGLLTLVGLAALRQVLFAHDAAGLRVEELGRFGGALGAGVAWPLERLVTGWGAGTFAFLLAGLGMLVTTRTPFSKVVAALRIAGRETGSAMWDAATAAGRDIARASRWAAPRVMAWVSRTPGRAGGSPEGAEPDHGGAEEEELGPVVERIRTAPLRVVPELGIDEPKKPPAPERREQLKLPAGAFAAPGGGYKLPPLELLSLSEPGSVSEVATQATISVLRTTLKQFNVDAAVTGYTPGPTVTRYEIELGEGVKVNRVVSLQNEIRYALASGELRILAPIPGRSAIGIEVPNRDRQLVTLGDVLRAPEVAKMPNPTIVGLGKDISGAAVGVSLAEMPHVLIAGATGSGKSSCINAMIVSILARARPDQVRLLLIDPKRVELSHYNGVPHLLTPVVTSPKKAAEALGWVVKEMEARYEVLAMAGMRNSDMYNEAVRSGALAPEFEDGTPRSPYPYYVVVVDELADLMMVAPRDVEECICRIAQMARAVGIHLVVATQRPSVDVVTGVIKANIPSRMAFATASYADSRVILDEGGADRLIGHGDLLYKHASAPRPRRIQCAWVAEREVEAVIGWCRRQRPNVDYVEGIVSEAPQRAEGSESDEDEELLRQAMELIVRSQLGSTSMLQRKLKVGFSRAGRLMDLLEQRGVVGMSQGSKPRDVLMTFEEWQDEEAARKAADAVIHPKVAPSQGPPSAGRYEAPPSMAPPVLHRAGDFVDPVGAGDPDFDIDR